jgi:hypothetical protein
MRAQRASKDRSTDRSTSSAFVRLHASSDLPDSDADHPRNHPKAVALIAGDNDRAQSGEETHTRYGEYSAIDLGDECSYVCAAIAVHRPANTGPGFEHTGRLKEKTGNGSDAQKRRIPMHASAVRTRNANSGMIGGDVEGITCHFAEEAEVPGAMVSETTRESSAVKVAVAIFAAVSVRVPFGDLDGEGSRTSLRHYTDGAGGERHNRGSYPNAISHLH